MKHQHQEPVADDLEETRLPPPPNRVNLEAILAAARTPDFSGHRLNTWILLRLHEPLDGTGAKVSAEEIAPHVGCSPRTLERHFSWLDAHGYLQQKQRGPGKCPARWTTVPEKVNGGKNGRIGIHPDIQVFAKSPKLTGTPFKTVSVYWSYHHEEHGYATVGDERVAAHLDVSARWLRDVNGG